MKRIDIDQQGTSQSGLSGLYERLLRRFKIAVHALTLVPLYALACVCIGISLIPGAFVFQFFSELTAARSSVVHYAALGFSLATGYFLYGFSMILIVPSANFLLRAYPTASRGSYYSLHVVKWYIHNALTYLVRYTFLEFITPTPFNLMFYRLMGMKIGKEVQINSVHISDPCLITMGDRVTIGGSATLAAHYGMGGYLVLAPIQIGKSATIGLKAIILGGVEIGEGAKILANSLVLPKTKIPAGETWGGVPAQKIETRQLRQNSQTKLKVVA